MALRYGIAIFSALCSVATLPAAQSFSYQTIRFPGAAQTMPFSINNAGHTVGFYSNGSSQSGFLLRNGSYSTIVVPGALHTQLRGINDAGQIVGAYYMAGVWRGFLYDNGTYTTFAYPGALHTLATGLNNAGQIVGFYFENTGINRGFLLSNNAFTPVDVPGSNYTSPQAIDSFGNIVGHHYDTTSSAITVKGFHRASTGTFASIEPPLSGTSVYAQGVNDNGQIVGHYANNASPLDNRGFIMSSLNTGSFQSVEVLGGRSGIHGLNSTGQITGFWGPASSEQGFIGTPEARHNICLLYDAARSVRAGATMPIKLQVCTASGGNLSGPQLAVAARHLVRTNEVTNAGVQDSGNANPDSNFRFDPDLGIGGGYVYNLSTKALSQGSYTLLFQVGSEPHLYSAPFQLR
jgi:uncharacterized membrane protein